MISLPNYNLNRLFRLKGEIYTEPDLVTCLNKLELNEFDLILTNTFLNDSIKKAKFIEKSKIINVDQFGSGEPREDWVNEILKISNAFPYRRVIAIGGGATIDISKLCVFGDGRSAEQLFNDKQILEKRRELIALPTTCGTGSEVTSVAVVEFLSLNSKLGLQIDELFPDKAVLIGELLSTLSYKTFALTSIDALAHAVESLLSPKANAYTDMYARSAIEGIVEKLKEVREKQILPKSMEQSLIFANMAGVAFSIAGCATMHALSFPLGSNYHLAHGEAVYAVFASTLEYYRKKNISISKLEKVLSPLFEEDGVKGLLDLLSDIYKCPDFKALGINDEICEKMATSVYQNQQRLLVNSPKQLNSDDLSNIYKNCIK